MKNFKGCFFFCCCFLLLVIASTLEPVSVPSFVSLSGCSSGVFYCKRFEFFFLTLTSSKTGSVLYTDIRAVNPSQKLTFFYYRDVHVTDSGTGPTWGTNSVP